MKFVYLCLLLLSTGLLTAQNTANLAQASSFAAQHKTAFEENKGQVWNTEGETATNVKYHFQEKGIDIFMLPTGLAYQFTKVHYPEGYQVHSKEPLSLEEEATQEALRAQIRTETYRMDMELVHANPNAKIIAEGKSKDYVQYYNRNALDVHSFKKLTYQAVYPGIDWVIYTTEKGLKYDFIVQPGADPSQIKLQFNHHEDLKINADGSFTLSNSMGSITEQAPISFQGKQEVSTAFKLEGDILSFDLSNYDKTKVLTIDPSLLWASYYGGASSDFGRSSAVDAAGNVYLVGSATSLTNIALLGHQNTFGGQVDAFIVKFNSAGTRLWASYYGGTNYDWGYSCAVDAAGNVYLVGMTQSTYNIAFSGHRNTFNGWKDAFIVKFNSAGTRLWASYYGGAGPDYANSCAVDGAGNVYLVGITESSANIASAGHQNTHNSGNYDAFIVKFNSAGTRLWASYYGGTDYDRGNSCAVDGAGNVYLVGITESSANIASTGHQNTFGGGSDDAFIVKFNSTGARLWASYYGGFGNDNGGSCAVDAAGNVYLAGSTGSTTGIASTGHQNTFGGGSDDAFIVKFNSTGARLWASYYGGASSDGGGSCAVDAAGNVYLAGQTVSTTNIALAGHQNTYGGFTDAFIVIFNSVGARLWASYYGGTSTETGSSCVVDAVGNIYLAGQTASTTNIASAGHQNTLSGGYDAFIVKLAGNLCISTTGIDTQTACHSYTWIDGITYTASNNTATDTLTNANGCDSIITLDLTISNPTTATDIQTACNSYTWIDGNSYTTSNNSATFTLTNSNGCDSIITLDLTINNPTTATDIQTACNSYTWIDGNSYTTSNNSATFTLTNANGCDSIITLDLTINNLTTATDIQTACNSYTWIDGNSYTASNNSATFTLTNANGCDSIITLDLTINNPTTATDIQTACNSYTWIDGNSYTASNNSATFTLTNANGCDSIITLDLTINNPTTATDIQTACNSYTWIDGNAYTTSNNSATFTLTNAAGCDSIITLDLTINTIDTTTSIAGTTITATTTGATYQWVDCSTGFSPINNATGQSFTPSQNGDYAVVINQNGCVDTSSCSTIIVVGLNDLATNNNITIYPNPTTENIHIDFGKLEQEVSLKLYSTDGKLIQSKTQIQGSLYQLKLPKTTGIYILEVKTTEGISHYKIIKE